jgi:hypothetical protein
MQFLVTCSLKSEQKFLDSRTCHTHGELRIVEFPNHDATLIEGEHGSWLRIEEPFETVIRGHHQVNGGCFVERFFFVTTFGQILKVSLEESTYQTFWTAPFLNDLHHVSFFFNHMYVVNTGLDRIEVVDPKDRTHHSSINLLKDISASKEFDLSMDYRHIWSTQPHLIHPNHCFLFDGEIWVTRFCQQDALALETGRRIDLSPWGGNPHDGLVRDDKVFFTTTNGHLIGYSGRDATYQSWDLNQIIGDYQLGWCRGLAIDDDLAFIAFTQFRPSVTKQMGKWILQGTKLKRNPTFILKLDMTKSKALAQYLFVENDLTIYGIYKI